MATVLDEIIDKSAQLSEDECQELIELLQKAKFREEPKKGFVHPNTVWIKKHRVEYAGYYVALKDGELIASGKTIKEVDLTAKQKNIENPLLTYLFPLGEEPFGGW